MSDERIRELEESVRASLLEIAALHADVAGTPVPDYRFRTLDGEPHLSSLFGDRDHMLVIHNMGQSCRYCRLWADGFNGLLPHLEANLAVVLASPDAPEAQRRFATSRDWRFRMVSHAGSPYIREQDAGDSGEGWPGAVMYQRDGTRILRRAATVFGPGDVYCALWPLLGMAGLGADDFTPQFRYWSRPETLIDGGADVRD